MLAGETAVSAGVGAHMPSHAGSMIDSVHKDDLPGAAVPSDHCPVEDIALASSTSRSMAIFTVSPIARWSNVQL